MARKEIRSYVIDASVVVKWFVDEEDSDIARRIRRIIDLKWSGIYDFASSLTIPASDDEYYEEGQKTRDIFEGHYKYR